MKNPIRKSIKRLYPRLFAAVESYLSRRSLNQLDRIPCNTERLGAIGEVKLKEALRSEPVAKEWQELERTLSSLPVRFSGGASAGGIRVLYHLVRYLHPRSILEIGTHLGVSASVMAMALKKSAAADEDDAVRLVTVDIEPVNDVTVKRWLQYGAKYSPLELVQKVGCEEMVRFVTANSTEYLRNCKEKYDLVFLDGNHSATTVYREIPAALELLNDGGWILLHDFFPDLKPLWSDQNVVHGPCMATQRLRREGANIVALPLGAAPWPTRPDSSLSSFALLGAG